MSYYEAWICTLSLDNWLNLQSNLNNKIILRYCCYYWTIIIKCNKGLKLSFTIHWYQNYWILRNHLSSHHLYTPLQYNLMFNYAFLLLLNIHEANCVIRNYERLCKSYFLLPTIVVFNCRSNYWHFHYLINIIIISNYDSFRPQTS